MALHKSLFLVNTNMSYYESNYKPLGLINSAEFIRNYLNTVDNVQAWVEEVTLEDQVDALIILHNPTLVVFEAPWVSPAKLKALADEYPLKTFVVRVHSQVAFLSSDSDAFLKLNSIFKLKKTGFLSTQLFGSSLFPHYENIIVATNNLEFKQQIESALGYEIQYLPNIYRDFTVTLPMRVDNSFINIGCFGGLRPLKNQVFQAICAIRAANTLGKILNFYINASIEDIATNPIYQNLFDLFKYTDHNLFVHEWLTHEEFLTLISTLDLGLQVSFSETFNIVAADFVSSGIPIIVSDSISWLPINYQSSTINSAELTSMIINFYENRNSEKLRLRAINYLNAEIEDAKLLWFVYFYPEQYESLVLNRPCRILD